MCIRDRSMGLAFPCLCPFLWSNPSGSTRFFNCMSMMLICKSLAILFIWHCWAKNSWGEPKPLMAPAMGVLDVYKRQGEAPAVYAAYSDILHGLGHIIAETRAGKMCIRDSPCTGPAGFEPSSAGVKVLCLTAWRRPNKSG